MDSGGTGAQEGLRALQGPPSLGPGLMASFMLSILKLPDSLIPLLPSKTIARTTARTGSDKMSLMAGPEGSGNRGGGWGDQWCPSLFPQGPSTPSLVLLVCVPRVPSRHRAPTWIRLWTVLGAGPSLYCLGRGWGKFTSLPRSLPWHLPPCAHPPFPLLSLAGGDGGQVGHY